MWVTSYWCPQRVPCKSLNCLYVTNSCNWFRFVWVELGNKKLPYDQQGSWWCSWNLAWQKLEKVEDCILHCCEEFSALIAAGIGFCVAFTHLREFQQPLFFLKNLFQIWYIQVPFWSPKHGLQCLQELEQPNGALTPFYTFEVHLEVALSDEIESVQVNKRNLKSCDCLLFLCELSSMVNCSSYLVSIWHRSYRLFLAQVTQGFCVKILSLNLIR